MTHQHHDDRFTPISDETLHATPGWSHKLVDNQQFLLRAVEELKARVGVLEEKLARLEASGDDGSSFD